MHSRLAALLIVATAAIALVGPATASAAASREKAEAPRAQASVCPPCAVAAAVAIRQAVVKVAPKAAKAIGKKVVKGSKKSKARIKNGSKRAYRWSKATAGKSGKYIKATFKKLPQIAQGCARGFAEHIRDFDRVSLLTAAIACGRGIIDRVVLKKDPLRPLEK